MRVTGISLLRSLLQLRSPSSALKLFSDSVRMVFYASFVEIPLPRSDRLAALPLPNPILRRAVPTLSRFLRLLISSMAESRGPAGVPVGSDSVVDDVPDKTCWAGVGGVAGRRLPPAKRSSWLSWVHRCGVSGRSPDQDVF